MEKRPHYKTINSSVLKLKYIQQVETPNKAMVSLTFFTIQTANNICHAVYVVSTNNFRSVGVNSKSFLRKMFKIHKCDIILHI